MIYFHQADKAFHFRGKRELQDFIAFLFKKEQKALSQLAYIFCSDEFLLQMNRDFLQHDYYTDIITFGLSAKGEPITGEIYISLDRVKDNAKTLGVTVREEQLRGIFHGALHLCGYKDKTKKDIALMRQKEDQYLRLYQKRTRS